MGVDSIKVTLVDPRYVSEEVLSPVYRVDFWDMNGGSSEHRLENAVCVDDVLAWAEANRQGRRAVIWVEYCHEGGTGMCRLRGQEPTGNDMSLLPGSSLVP